MRIFQFMTLLGAVFQEGAHEAAGPVLPRERAAPLLAASPPNDEEGPQEHPSCGYSR